MSQGHSPGVSLRPAADTGQAASVTEEQVREELSRVLACHEFRASKRSQDFLRYVVENTLQGHGDMLKERTIGIEVFGRPTSYDPSDDATVRVKAGEVRKRLGLYYSDLGSRNPVRIELPSGTADACATMTRDISLLSVGAVTKSGSGSSRVAVCK